jgi:predicted alpha/beta-hydrolase family hydrolase
MSEVQIQAGGAVLPGDLRIPNRAAALVLFAHGSGSSRHSPRNQFVARTLNDPDSDVARCLLTQEEAIDMQTRELRFSIHLLAERPFT